MAAITPDTIERLEKEISILNLKLVHMEIWVLSLVASLSGELKKSGTLTDTQIAFLQSVKLQKGGERRRKSKKKISKKKTSKK